MKCEEYQSLIEEYVDGELNNAVAESVRNHISGCQNCTGLARNLRAEQQLYATYEPALELTPHLWAGIEVRLDEQSTVRREGWLDWLRSVFTTSFAVPRFSGWATAALVILAIGATAVFMKYTQRQQHSNAPADSVAVVGVKPAPPSIASAPTSVTTPEVSATPNTDKISKPRQPVTARSNVAVQRIPQTSAVKTPGKTPNQLVQEAEQKYLMAIAMLSRDASRKRSQIDPLTRARLDQAIASIDRTIAGTRQAVRQHPGDPVAVQYMLAAYARKVDLLRDIAAQ